MSAPDKVIDVRATTLDGAEQSVHRPQRQCGRCRKVFDVEADFDQRVIREWWACPPCRAALMPAMPRGGGAR